MTDAVLVDCLRTPVGKANRGTLRNTRPDDLAATAIRALLARHPQVPADDIEDVILGCAMPEAESGSNMARMSALRAGLPVTTTGVTINRFCSSGLQSIAMAADRIRARRRPHPHRRRQRIHEHDPHGRQQTRAQPLVRRSLPADLHQHGPHRRAGAAQVRHLARRRRRLLLSQPSERAAAPRPKAISTTRSFRSKWKRPP